ncbi:hypothetical protein CLIB1423_10S05314 [[Candida] railenensis]|uniref:Uncharacterized protein n=1 Tax=[Candida] railenensis TaxID=45579 RepID=A0A9P0VYZ8_9ASCO|nr:hypothetical protein CLIB1423_10S05314 [[Candida] railenensis]
MAANFCYTSAYWQVTHSATRWLALSSPSCSHFPLLPVPLTRAHAISPSLRLSLLLLSPPCTVSLLPLSTPSCYTLSLHPLPTPSPYTLSLHPLPTPSPYTLSLRPLPTPSPYTPASPPPIHSAFSSQFFSAHSFHIYSQLALPTSISGLPSSYTQTFLLLNFTLKHLINYKLYKYNINIYSAT